MRSTNMKYSALIAILVLLTTFSCQKEIIVPVQQENEEVFNTRGSSRNPTNGEGDNGSVTDPDNETEDDKIRKKKKTSN